MSEAIETVANELLFKATSILDKIAAEPKKYVQKYAMELFDVYFAGHNLGKVAKTLGADKKLIERIKYEADLARAAAQEYADTQDTAEVKEYEQLPFETEDE